jgi:predicted GNAT superfamily acetyltransferase
MVLRDIEEISEMRAVEQMQRDVWGFSDRDIVPVMTFIPTIEVGGILVGAFDDDRLLGFAYGFLGRENGEITLHSDMLAVLPEYRSRNVGYKLKLAQRERALAAGIRTMTWTFDPLQSRNAHLNFEKLGVVSNRYRVDHYGDESSSFLHQDIGTDRLWVRWPLDSLRVKRRLEGDGAEPSIRSIPGDAVTLVGFDTGGPVRLNSVTEVKDHQHLTIEIPGDIVSIQQTNLEVARAWRELTREAFTEALAIGYIVEEFCRVARGELCGGAYVLRRGNET